MKNHLARWLRPRFSLRTLAVFVALVGMYFAAWTATTQSVMRKPVSFYGRPAVGVPAPFLCWAESYRTRTSWVGGIQRKDVTAIRQYYLWIFGPKIRLPFESTRQIPVQVI